MMRKPGPLIGLLLLACLAIPAQVAFASSFWLLTPDKEPFGLSLEFDPWMFALPQCSDMALGPLQSVLLITGEGQLLLVDGAERQGLDGSLLDGVWPEAIAADGTDWLLLHRLGGEIIRLGRRGEYLGRVQLPQGRWRDAAVCISGRIWLADLAGERFLAMGRGGQTLQDWSLPRLLSGQSGGLDSWCTDGEGGLVIAMEAGVFHLNAAGNIEGSWKLPEFTKTPSLVAVGDGRILVSEQGEDLAHMIYRRDLGLLVLADGGRKILSAPNIPEPRP
jgi:hypothetical protein